MSDSVMHFPREHSPLLLGVAEMEYARSDDPEAWIEDHLDDLHPGSRDECGTCQPVPGAARPLASQRGPARISAEDRWTVWERDNFTCQRCGSRRMLSIDHIVPRSKGGADHVDNYQTLCRRCNSGKRDRI